MKTASIMNFGMRRHNITQNNYKDAPVQQIRTIGQGLLVRFV